MKKAFLFFTLFTFSALYSMGQTKSKKVDILWGPELKASKKSTLSDIVGYDETGIYAIKKKIRALYGLNSPITLEHYDQKMALSKSVEIELKEQKKKRKFEFIIHIDNEMYIFSSFANQKLKKNFLFVQGLDKKTLQPKKDLKKIAEIDYSGKSKYNSGSFDYEISRDSSKVLVYYNLPYDKGESEKFGFHVFDKSMNQLWEKKITLPYKEELFELEDYEVDNRANVYLLGTIFKEKRKEKRKGKPNYKYQVLSYSNNGSELKEYPIKIEGKFLTDMQIAINDEQDIICGGFYSSEGTFSIEGSYFLKIDGQTKEIKSKGFQEFGIDFITQNMTVRKKKKTKKKAAKGKDTELYQYDLNNIILRDDGGAVLIGEQYYVDVVIITTTGANGSMSTTAKSHYYYNDIIVINMSPDGKIEWTKKIAKSQGTVDDVGFFSSYALSVVKDKLYFVFNDNPRNLFYKGTGKLYNFNKSKESLVVLVTLDSEGNQTREALFSAREADILTRPKVCKQISNNEMVLFGQRKKTHRFAKISFKQ